MRWHFIGACLPYPIFPSELSKMGDLLPKTEDITLFRLTKQLNKNIHWWPTRRIIFCIQFLTVGSLLCRLWRLYGHWITYWTLSEWASLRNEYGNISNSTAYRAKAQRSLSRNFAGGIIQVGTRTQASRLETNGYSDIAPVLFTTLILSATSSFSQPYSTPFEVVSEYLSL